MYYDKLHTPSFIFDEAEFKRGIDGFGYALRTQFGCVEIGYSVKTNSLPYAMRMAGMLGCMAEVVSHDEYELARLCGFAHERIIYNGPMKSKETFLEAIKGGAVVNLETKRELKWLEELPDDEKFNIGIRLNINISHVSYEDADGEDDNSRFGFSDESCEFANALDMIKTFPNIRLAGLPPRVFRNTIYPLIISMSVADISAFFQTSRHSVTMPRLSMLLCNGTVSKICG